MATPELSKTYYQPCLTCPSDRVSMVGGMVLGCQGHEVTPPWWSDELEYPKQMVYSYPCDICGHEGCKGHRVVPSTIPPAVLKCPHCGK